MTIMFFAFNIKSVFIAAVLARICIAIFATKNTSIFHSANIIAEKIHLVKGFFGVRNYMTVLEQLLAEQSILTQKIIAEAKKEALSGIATSAPNINLDQKLDLFSHISNNFDNLIKDKKEKNILTPYVNPYNWPRNNNCWAKSLDLTGYCACIVPLGGVGGGTLITKKHVLLSNHVPYSSSPFMMFFVNNNNVSLVYNVIKTKRVANTDILIGELDREVDASLKIYNVLPANYLKYFGGAINFPLLYSDQERKALIGENGMINTTYGSTNTLINISKDPNRAQYFEPLIGGDSGNIVSTIINNEIVVIGAWYMTFGSSAGLATNVPSYITDINNTIASMTSGYKVTEADLSGFKMY